MQLIYLLFCSTAIHQVFSNQCCVPLSLPYSASQPQTASAICNLPTISFGQVVSQGHGTVPSTAKPVRIREVDIQFSVVNATCSIFFVMAVEWGLLYDLSEFSLVFLDHYGLIEERAGLEGSCSLLKAFTLVHALFCLPAVLYH